MHDQAVDLDTACLTAHGDALADTEPKTLVVVFYGAVAHELLLIGARLGYSIALLDPDDARREEAAGRVPGLVAAPGVGALPRLDDRADVVVADHHRDDLGPVLRDLLSTGARWIGLMGAPRHVGPHVEALTALGVAPSEIARVHRPIGLDIGSKTPAEIAVAALAGLIADRAGRPGGFSFAS
jgi:xanthine/CO dehydrogenase XdhC/CoxF family maturation factor